MTQQVGMDKKLLISIIVLAILVVGGIWAYMYFNDQPTLAPQNQEQSFDSAQDEPNNQNSNPLQNGGIEIETGNGNSGGLTICSDKCGDGICQDTQEELTCKSGNPNCICKESVSECPQDCK